MTTLKSFSMMCVLACGLTVLGGWTTSAKANYPDMDYRTANEIGTAIVRAAHPWADSPRLLRHDVAERGIGEVVVSLKVEWYGRFTGIRYVSDVELTFSTFSSRLIGLDYSDNFTGKRPNWENLRRLQRDINYTMSGR